MVGLISGVVALSAIESRLIFGFLEPVKQGVQSMTNIGMTFLLCFVSGYSEVMIPSLIGKIEEQSNKPDPVVNAPAPKPLPATRARTRTTAAPTDYRRGVKWRRIGELHTHAPTYASALPARLRLLVRLRPHSRRGPHRRWLGVRGDVGRGGVAALAVAAQFLCARPRPLVTLWCGPVVGVVVPLLAGWVARRSAVWFVAWFCVLANGAYIATGWLMGDSELDTTKLLAAGAPVWSIGLYVVATVVPGYVGFRREWLRVWKGQPPDLRLLMEPDA